MSNCIVCLVVIAYSLLHYQSGTGWSTECYGFIYGLLLVHFIDAYKKFGEQKWLTKIGVGLMVGLLLGLAYLNYKQVDFFGDYLTKIALGIALTNVVLLFTIKYKLGNKVSRFLGEISYEVYLLHRVVFSIIRNTLFSLSSGAYVFLTVIITIILAWIVNQISRKITSEIMNRCRKTC